MHCHHGSTAKLWKSIGINELDLRFDAVSGSLKWVEGYASPCVASSLFETKLVLFLCVAGWLIWSQITKIAFSSSRVVCSGITWGFSLFFSFQTVAKIQSTCKNFVRVAFLTKDSEDGSLWFIWIFMVLKQLRVRQQGRPFLPTWNWVPWCN